MIKTKKQWVQNHEEFIKNNKLILQIQKRFKFERRNVVSEEINKINNKFK